MPLTTSDNMHDPSLGGKGKSKPLCWDCGKPNPVMTVHPGYGYRLCPGCAEKEGLKPVPIELADEKEDVPYPDKVAGEFKLVYDDILGLDGE